MKRLGFCQVIGSAAREAFRGMKEREEVMPLELWISKKPKDGIYYVYEEEQGSIKRGRRMRLGLYDDYFENREEIEN